jgi:hypothetical protein
MVTGAAVVVVATPKDEERHQAEAEQPGASREIHVRARVIASFDLVDGAIARVKRFLEPVPASNHRASSPRTVSLKRSARGRGSRARTAGGKRKADFRQRFLVLRLRPPTGGKD